MTFVDLITGSASQVFGCKICYKMNINLIIKGTVMETILQEARFDFLSAQNKAFILAFDNEMGRLGYTFGRKIGSGFCWGKYMVIYTRAGVKSDAVYARIYMREHEIVLRLFLNKLDKHHLFLEQAPAYIKEVFTGPHAACSHDRDDGSGNCKFRKSYTLDGRLIEKCNGITFEFHEPTLEKLCDYLALFTEFYPKKR
jgi:hypothetical protein